MILSDIKKVELFRRTTPLAAGDVFISSSYEVTGYTKLCGFCITDQSGDLYIEQSGDESNWDYVEQKSLTGGTGVGFLFDIVAKYIRIRLVNGATAQTYLRLFAYLRTL